MNHLAHSVLSCNDQDLLMGNMLTDFVKLKEAQMIHEDFQKGITLHRFIDKFMDSHSITKEAVNILRPSQGKYASVSIDLLWDYMLARNWDRYQTEPVKDYANFIYEGLENSYDRLPDHLIERFQSLISYKFLEQYSEEWRFQKVLERMQKRAKFKANFDQLLPDIANEFVVLEKLFNEFFPLAIEAVEVHCDC